MGRSYYTVCLCISVATLAATGGEARGYYGSKIGGLETLQHGVRGQVYAIDSRTIHIQGFSYDGNAPDAFFYGGSSSRPGEDGFIIPDEDGGMQPLGRYINKDVTLTLPKGKTLQDVRWISVWCRAFAIDFGHVIVDKNLDYPRPQKIEAFTKLDHGVSSDRIVVVDAQTFLIPSFTYDGTAPDGHFWVGKGSPDNSGTVVPDENGSEEPLKKYLDKTIVITLPGDLTVFDIDYLSVWCRAFLANFGYVSIPKSLNVPPSLKMLGVAPQTKLNCEVLWDALALEVRWAVAGESIVMQLVGRIEDRQYMAFGTSGTSSRSVMVNGDVVIAWLDQTTGRGVAQDYYLTDKAQCQGGRGACPDTKITGNGNNVRLLNAALINNFTMLTFQRPLRAVDHADTTIFTNGSQAVIWAVGPINSQGDPSYHRLRQKGDVLIDFGRIPRWNCPLPEEESGTGQHAPHTGPANPPPVPPTNNAWYIPPVPCHEPDDGVFYAQIGPTGGESGYNAITGHVGWGISWYVNGLLIPEIYVVRGKTYTFVVEGGYDPEHPARYHPFYISDDPEGGYEFKTPAERSRIRVFAGVGQDRDGRPVPTAFGRLCEWSEDPNQSANAFSSFGAYQRTLQLDCQEGQPGILQWTPDSSTPDTVYYQCYTHRFLGWKIHVLDTCDLADGLAVAGSVDTTVVAQGGAAPDYDYYDYDYVWQEMPLRRTHHPETSHISVSHTNSIPGRGAGKPPRRPVPPRARPQTGPAEQRFPGDFSLPNLPRDFAADFPNFPFDMNPKAIEQTVQRPILMPAPPRSNSSPQVPLGAPGFTFPKLPNLKSSSVVNATAFANLGSANFGHLPREVPEEFLVPQTGNLEISKLGQDDEDHAIRPLRNQYPLNPGTTMITNHTVTSLEPFTPRVTTQPRFSFPSVAVPTRLPTSSQTSSGFFDFSTPLRNTTNTVLEESLLEPKRDLKNTSELRVTSTRSTASHWSVSTKSATAGRQPSSHIPTTIRLSVPHEVAPPSTRPTFDKLTTIKQVTPYGLTPSRQLTSPKPNPITQPTPTRRSEVTGVVEHARTATPFTPTINTRQPVPVHESYPSGQPSFRESEIITAPSVSLFPGHPSPVLKPERRQPSRKGPSQASRVPASQPTTHSPQTTSPTNTLSHNFGFDPDSVVYESDFRPIKKENGGPVLAFEVSSFDVMPFRGPHPPSQSLPLRPAGPRTSGFVRFAHRNIRFHDTDESSDEDLNVRPKERKRATNVPNPVLHTSLTFSESLDPPPLLVPVPMVPIRPRLGGAASNQPLNLNRPIKRPPSVTRNGPRWPNIPVRPSGNVDRIGWPKQMRKFHKMPKRRVTALVPLPDDHTVPVPQLVGPGILKPVLVNFPVEHDDGEELSAAASTQVFTSDGRPLSSDTLPTPPQLASARRLTSASIISRPKVGPFRGDHPPPVPAQVPHLAQFSIQRRPLSRRRTTVSLPPLDSRSSQHGPTLSTSGSAPRPVVVAYSQDESRTTGHKVISFTEQPMTTYNSTRLQTTALTNLAATNQTHLTILKDVWAILTRENPDLNSEHPRDDAYPEHDHLAQQERGRREAFSPEGTRSTASSGRALLLHSMFAWSVAIIVALAR
ncbi:uncharacterized protein [Panulirus ornatus]|uniref:uncharacterized protein isoform X2 n=1 Tax=Panulirus ornatus TaxID=150431 RepID=UPI003A8750E9